MGLDGSQDTPALNSPGPPPSGTDTLVEVAEAHREMAGATSWGLRDPDLLLPCLTGSPYASPAPDPGSSAPLSSS